MNIDDLDELESAIESGEVKFTDNAVIYFGNYNAGTETTEGKSFGQKMADITGRRVIAGRRTREHGQVAPKKEDSKTGELVYQMSYPEDNFYLFQNGKEPEEIDRYINLESWIERGTFMPLEMPVIKLEVPEPAPLIQIEN